MTWSGRLHVIGEASVRRVGTGGVPGPRGCGYRRLRGTVRVRLKGAVHTAAQDWRGRMTSVPGVDHPEEQTEAEVTLSGRGISVSTRVEFVQNDFISVRPSVGEFVDQVVVQVGDVVEVFWKNEDAQRALPAEITEVEQGAVIRWRLRATGPAEASQRRQAVRGRVSVPVVAEYGSIELRGETVDLSEAGLRAEFDGLGAPPEAGAKLDLSLVLEDGGIKTKAEVVRTQARGAQWVISIRFAGLQEKDQDRVRRRVFQALREERARRADDAPPGLRG